MSSLRLEKLPLHVARAIRAGKRLRIMDAGQTIATVEPRTKAGAATKQASKSLTARQWITTVAGKLPARPDLDAAAIVRQAREAE